MAKREQLPGTAKIEKETICALSTARGRGAIALLRISGADSKRLTEKLIKTRQELLDRQATKGILDAGKIRDDVIVVYYRAPRSYTGEDMAEICCHGSDVIVENALRFLVENGARLAQRGEFTLRAFENGKMDLTEAEGVVDLIDAQCESAARAAYGLASGALKKKIDALSQKVAALTADVNVTIDYPEEDLAEIGETEAAEKLEDALQEAQSLARSYDAGKKAGGGVNVVIAGKPNAGKSTLLNALLGYERAIVTDEAGTTRDTVEASYVYDGMLYNVTDTAGLRKDAENEAEKLGIERSLAALRGADVILALDDSVPCGGENVSGTVLRVYNKADIVRYGETDGIIVSAKTGAGMDALKEAVAKVAVKSAPSEIMLTNLRQYEAVKSCTENLQRAKRALHDGLSGELVSVDLMAALQDLHSVTGVRADEQVIHAIFSRFCVGK